MKNSLLSTCAAVLLMLSYSSDSYCQESTKAFFVELGGNGLFFSANYDMRFGQTTKGPGARVGIGYVGGGSADGSVVTVPLMINHLLGNGGNYFEIGAGITYVSANADFIGDNLSDSAVWGTLSFMYRKQPTNGGFLWKIGITPIIADGIFVPYWIGIGLGYAF